MIFEISKRAALLAANNLTGNFTWKSVEDVICKIVGYTVDTIGDQSFHFYELGRFSYFIRMKVKSEPLNQFAIFNYPI